MAEDIQKRNKRQNLWKKENRDRINILFSKGLKEKITEAANASGVSMSNYIETAVNEKMKNDGLI